RPGDHAVHLLPAGGRDRPRADLRRADLRPRAHRDVPPGRGRRLQGPLVRRSPLRRGPPRGGVRAVALLVRAGRRRPSPAALRQRAGRGLAPPEAGGPHGAARLRLVPQELPCVQRPRRARRDLGEPAGGDDPGHPQARVRDRRAAGGRRIAGGGGGRSRVPEPARAQFLLEIGGEEMPAPWLPGLREQLAQRFREAAEREHLRPEDVRSLGTPRRMVLRSRVLARQEDREEKVWGPSLKVARDAQGAWTSAAQGFARKNGVAPEALGQEAKNPAAPAELSLVFVKKTAGRAAAEVLPGVMASLLRALAFPKKMSWDAWIEDGKGAFPFGRPIRWLVALLDGKVVPFTIYSLEDGARGRP